MLSTCTRQLLTLLFDWQSLAEELHDPASLVGSDAEKEFSRARKVMGAAWVAEVGLITHVVLRVYIGLLFRLKEGVTCSYDNGPRSCLLLDSLFVRTTMMDRMPVVRIAMIVRT